MDNNEDKGKVHAPRWELYMKDKWYFIKIYFWWWLLIQKEGTSFELLWRKILLRKMRSTNQLDYMHLIINYPKKRRVEGFDRD